MPPALPLALLLALSAAPAAEPEAPSEQTLLFFNARLALREKKPAEVLKLWLVRNQLAADGKVGPHDEEFRSVVWAALGDLGLCQDGFPPDDKGGAGLWPLALHNWAVQAAAKGPPPKRQAPFDAFEVSRQRRFVSLHDQLSLPELRSVSFFRTKCLLPQTIFATDLDVPAYNLADRYFAALLLQRLLQDSMDSLQRAKVVTLAPIEARLFDLELVLANLEARRLRREALAKKQRARQLGMSEQGALEAQEAASKWPDDSRQARFLRRSLGWTPAEWLALSRERRLFLFSQARPFSKDAQQLDQLELGVLDLLVERGAGEEVESWIGFFGAETPERRAALFDGERGRRLLALDRQSGFRERSSVALHRGVAFLERGERQEALRAFAFAMAHAEESREAETSMALGRRWLSFVLSRYQTDDEVIATLKALVPRQEYNAVIEDLVWRAALRADAASFERVVASARRGGAFDAKVQRLRPLSQGKSGEMLTLLRDAAVDEPHLTLRFVRQLLERVESEEADVRAANAPALHLLFELLEELGKEQGRNKAQQRGAVELAGRTQAILEGLGQLELSTEARARAMAPYHEAFAGNVRLAPADPLPWPFRAPDPEAPSAFVPLGLEPIEWRDAQGERVFGWRLTE